MLTETKSEKILKCHYNIFKKKNLFKQKCLFIFLLQYCVQKYCVWRGPYKETLQIKSWVSKRSVWKTVFKTSIEFSLVKNISLFKNQIKTNQKVGFYIFEE